MAFINYENLPSENTPLTGGVGGNLNEMQKIVNVSNEVDEDYRVNFLKSKNLFDANNVLNGMGIASGGTITSATDNGLFYIPVVVGKTYVFSFTDNGVSGNVVWGYTSQAPANGVSCTYNVITNANLNGATFTPTGTQKYLCIRLNTSANNQYNAMGNIQCEVGSTATTYEEGIPNQIVVDNEKYSDTLNVGNVVDSRSRINVLYSKNLFDNSNLTNGYLNDNGTITTNTDFRVSDYINVSDMSKITISGNSGGSERICFYNSSKTFISTVNTSTNTTMAIDVPNNATYVRATIKATNLNIYTIQEGSSIITPSIYVDDEEIYSKPVVLWENGSPTSAFASQQITLSDNISNYTYYEVQYLFSTSTSGIELSTGKLDTNKYGYLGVTSSSGGNIACYRRLIDSLSSGGNKITFGGGSLITTSGTTSDNTICVPYKVLGYK